ncbi:cytochrome P450 [Nonomuraea sp. B12E4]|uniref:cytochrome P450 n=1 Tax=Nonomuraea sp. B12E4 TaxID=3153564 RepID=UPI00325C9873
MSTDTTTGPGRPTEIPYYPMERSAGCPFDPPPELRDLQARTPLTKVRLWDGSTPWLVTRYAEQRALLADPRISADTTRPGYPFATAGIRERRKIAQTFISMDDPGHARLRRMVTAPFTVRRIEALRPAVQRIVDRLIDDMLAGPRPVDLVQAFALPAPSLVICELLGVPYADHDFFQSCGKVLVNRDTSPRDQERAQNSLTDYLERLVEDKQAHPGDDLLSRLAVGQVATGALSRREAALMSTLLLVAGHETTANMIALGTLALLRDPVQLGELRDGDPALIAGAVEELLRYLTIVHTGRRRVAVADIEIGGQVIRAGDGVILASEIGNRDTEVFDHPDRLDGHRDAHGHMAFGFGVHQCLGQNLARMELQVAYGTLYRRIPDLRLAVDAAQVRFKHDGLIYGVYELPVTW